MTADQLAHIYFGLELPTTLSQLKSAYRVAAKKAHSDVGGSDEQFVIFNPVIIKGAILL